MSLLVVGTMAFDTVETPFGKAERIIGGAATYICYAASQFVKESHAVSIIGGDFPDAEIKSMHARGIHTDGVEIKKDGKSFFWAGRYHDNMISRDTLITDLNVLAEFNPIVPANAKHAQYVMLGNLQPGVQMQVIKQMAKKPKLVVLDTMNFWMDCAMDDLKKVLKKADVLTVNDEEARQLSGEHSLVKAARAIRKMGPSALIIKKGEHGALLFHEQGEFFAPAMNLEEVIDPTGAGDSFAGGFIGYMASSGRNTFANMKRAVVYGSAVASFCVEKFGIDGVKNLTEAQFKARIREFEKLMKVDL